MDEDINHKRKENSNLINLLISINLSQRIEQPAYKE